MGYTAQFGNGFSATIAAEAPRKTQIIDVRRPVSRWQLLALASFRWRRRSINGAFGGAYGGAYGGFQAPDVVANLRVDQAWGSAQIMGALHDVNADLLSGSALPAGPAVTTSTRAQRWPSGRQSWVGLVGGGFKLNTPWLLSWLGSGKATTSRRRSTTPKALCVISTTTTNSNWTSMRVLVPALACAERCGLGGASGGDRDLELTTAWNVNAAYEHFWSPRWRTSLYGGYAGRSPTVPPPTACFAASAYQWHSLSPTAATTTGTPGGSVRALSGTSPRTSTWAWT